MKKRRLGLEDEEEMVMEHTLEGETKDPAVEDEPVVVEAAQPPAPETVQRRLAVKRSRHAKYIPCT